MTSAPLSERSEPRSSPEATTGQRTAATATRCDLQPEGCPDHDSPASYGFCLVKA
jgi:hypothetical protein